MTNATPRGWRVQKSTDLLEFVTSGSRGWAQYYSDSGPAFVRIGNLDHDTITLDMRDVQHVAPPNNTEGARTRLQPGDILISITAELGMVGLIPEGLGEAYINQHIALARPKAGIDARYLAWFFASDGKRQLLDMRRGVTKAGLGLDDIRNVDVLVPPLNEQRRIVAKLESLRSRSRRAREALDAVPPLLEKLRQSILAAAFRGDLTKDWRAQNPNPEPASALLARIRTERRQKWEASELAKLQVKGRAPTNDSWKAKYKEPEPVDTTGLPELPEGWCWASLHELLSEGLANGRSVPTDDNGFPVLRLTALKHGRLDLRERKGGAWSAEDAAPFCVRRNDFLVSRGNGSLALVGRGGLVDTEPDGVAFPDTLIRIRTHELLSHDYLSRVWNASLVRTQIERAAKTTAGIFKVSQGDLESVVLPVPSRGEQICVCSILDAAMDRVRRLEIAAEVTRAASSTIERSILAKAFRGELVPQDPNDEPAVAMLARLRSEAPAESSHQRARRSKAAE